MKRPKHPSFEGLPNFLRVNARLFRGGRPTGPGMANLKELGVRTIVDLRGCDGTFTREGKRARALGIQYHRIPMGNLRGPRLKAVDRVLRILAEPESWPVYVHCWRGCDRTGTLIACYRVANESWGAERAIVEAIDHGMQGFEVLKRDFIRRFHRSRSSEHAPRAGRARRASSVLRTPSTGRASSARRVSS